MTALDVREVLADPSQGGAYFVDARDTQARADAAGALAFAVARIELTDCRDKATALSAIARGLRFPDWFGANFDALADCLEDREWVGHGAVIVLRHTGAFRKAHAADWATLDDIFAEAAEYWQERHKPFFVFVE